MSGFGLGAFGASPFGVDFGAPVVASDGTPIESAAFAKLVFGDYELDENDNLTDSDDPVDAEVAWRLATVVGSFVDDPALGNGVLSVRVLSTSSPVETVNAVTRALEPMLTRGVIEKLDVEPVPELRNGVAWNAYSVS